VYVADKDIGKTISIDDLLKEINNVGEVLTGYLCNCIKESNDLDSSMYEKKELNEDIEKKLSKAIYFFHYLKNFVNQLQDLASEEKKMSKEDMLNMEYIINTLSYKFFNIEFIDIEWRKGKRSVLFKDIKWTPSLTPGERVAVLRITDILKKKYPKNNLY